MNSWKNDETDAIAYHRYIPSQNFYADCATFAIFLRNGCKSSYIRYHQSRIHVPGAGSLHSTHTTEKTHGKGEGPFTVKCHITLCRLLCQTWRMDRVGHYRSQCTCKCKLSMPWTCRHAVPLAYTWLHVTARHMTARRLLTLLSIKNFLLDLSRWLTRTA